MSLKDTYVANVKKSFRKVSPVWSPPYKTAVAVAKQMKLEITINKKPGSFWVKNIDRIFDNVDHFNHDMRITLKNAEEKVSVNLTWADPRKVEEF